MQRNPSLAVLVNQRELKWGSCKTISANLQRSYSAAFGKRVAFHEVHGKENEIELWTLARRLHRSRPGRIVFLDHVPHPLPILRALRAVFGKTELPELVFHVYGDFTLYPDAWLAAGEFLRGASCRFLCASPREQNLLASFLRSGHRNLALLPFPVNVSAFRYLPGLRTRWRKRLSLRPHERAFLYSGRISLQKNITLAVEALAAAGVHLLLAGSEDDLDGPPFGLDYPQGTYGAQLEETIQRLSPRARARVRRLGTVSAATMNGLYNAADAFVSLGLHHDEDYGMSVAEAQCTGLPCLLTGWGGFSSFVREPADGALVKVTLGTDGLRISRAELRGKIAEVSERASQNERAERASNHQALYSETACARTLSEIAASRAPAFNGFSDQLSWFAFQTASGNRHPFPLGPQKNTLYEKIYGPYYE